MEKIKQKVRKQVTSGGKQISNKPARMSLLSRGSQETFKSQLGNFDLLFFIEFCFIIDDSIVEL